MVTWSHLLLLARWGWQVAVRLVSPLIRIIIRLPRGQGGSHRIRDLGPVLIVLPACIANGHNLVVQWTVTEALFQHGSGLQELL